MGRQRFPAVDYQGRPFSAVTLSGSLFTRPSLALPGKPCGPATARGAQGQSPGVIRAESWLPAGNPPRVHAARQQGGSLDTVLGWLAI